MKLTTLVPLLVLAAGCSKKAEEAPSADEPQAAVKQAAKKQKASLKVDVVTSPEMAGAVNSALIHGPKEVLIVDAQFTKSGATAVADAAEKTGKAVKRVFITHAHPDHYLGTAILKQRFPNAKFLAVPSVVAEMKASAAQVAAQRKGMLGPEFPGEPVIPDAHEGDTLSVDGVLVKIMNDLKGDTHTIAGLYIESLGTLIASDVGYIDVHLWTATTDHDGRMAWAKQVAELAKLPGLKRVVPGHQLASSKQDASVLSYTGEYIKAFDTAAAEAKNADELMAAMKQKYPELKGAMFLQFGSQAAFAPAK